MNEVMIKRALVLTLEPEKIIGQCRRLAAMGLSIIANREAVKALKAHDIPVTDVQDFIGIGYEYNIPPTLHPKMEAALTDEHFQERIDLVFDIPYPLSKGNDIGGRTLLALGAKGRRLVINNYEDLDEAISLLEQRSDAINDLRERLMAKVYYKIAQHYVSFFWRYSEKYRGILGEGILQCREGENPYQSPCFLFESDTEEPLGIPRFRQCSGEKPCFTNLADLDNIVSVLERIKSVFLLNYHKIPYIVVAAKHGNPCGLAVDWDCQREAVKKALWGNPESIWGGEVVTNFGINLDLAKMFLKSAERENIYGNPYWMLDLIAAPQFSDEAIGALGKRRQRKILVNPELAQGLMHRNKEHLKFIRGGFLCQPPHDYLLNLNDIGVPQAIPSSEKEAILIAWATAYGSFLGGNEVAIAKDSMLLGVGGGPSTTMAARHVVGEAVDCGHETKGAYFCADAFFPFTGAPEILGEAGCKAGVVPAGGKNQDLVHNYFKSKDIGLWFIPEQYRGFCRH